MSLIPKLGGSVARIVALTTSVFAVLAFSCIAWLAPAQAGTVIGIEYQHSNYGGWAWNVTVSANGAQCTTSTGNVDFQSATLGGWNDIISSFRTYANCWAKHYEHSYFGGASVGYGGTTSYIGNAMNDRTSSIRWS